MQRLIAPLAAAAAAVLITLAATSMTSRAAGSYADDRSEIEDLQARYLFALDLLQAPHLQREPRRVGVEGNEKPGLVIPLPQTPAM